MRQLRAWFIDPKYGQAILAKSVKQSYWYWQKIVLVVQALYSLLLLAVLVYYLPQLSGLTQKHLPAKTTLSHGQLTLDPPTPWIIKLDKSSSLVFTETGTSLTTSSGTQKLQSYPQDLVFSLSSRDLALWIDSHQIPLLVAGFLFVITLSVAIAFSHSLFQGLYILVFSAVAFVLSKSLTKPLSFSTHLKLLFHASIPAFLLSLFFVGFTSQVVYALAALYYYLTWRANLPLQPYSR